LRADSSLNSAAHGEDIPEHYILHTLSFEILLPHIVVIPPEFDIKISAIDVESLITLKSSHLEIIILAKKLDPPHHILEVI